MYHIYPTCISVCAVCCTRSSDAARSSLVTIFDETLVENYSVYVSLPSSFLLEASSIGNQPCLRKPQSFPQPKGGDGEVTNNTENIEDNNIRIPYTRDIVHVDEVEHAPCVPEFGTVVEERFRENATVAIVPMVLRYDEPRVANLRRDKVQQDALV